MVSAKQGNNKRRGGGKQGNNKRFKPATQNSNDFNNRVINAAMFNVSQIPDNPGYVDFNEPSPIIQQQMPQSASINGGVGTSVGACGNGSGNGNKINGKGRFRRGGNVGGGNMKQRNNQISNSIGNRNFNSSNMNGNRRGGGGGQQRLNGPPIIPNRNFRNFMSPRMGGLMGVPQMCPMPPPPPPIMNGGRFGPRPFLPSPLAGRGRPMGPLRPLPMRVGPIMPPRNRRSIRNGPPVLPPVNVAISGQNRRKNLHNNRKNLKNRKRNSGTADGGISKGKNKKSNTTKKTLKEIVNQYSLDRPWVTEEIKAEAKIKEDIENRLKGKKDDVLFAEFKVQRDKFVSLYEAAKIEHLESNKKPKDIEKTLPELDITNSKQDTISNETVEAAATT